MWDGSQGVELNMTTNWKQVMGVIALAVLIGSLGFSVPVVAQQTTASPEQVQQMLDRIAALEKEVKELREKQASVPAAAAPEPAPVEMPQVHTVNDRLRLNVFGDVGFQASDLKGNTNTFRLGSLDLFMTSRLSDKASVLAEILFIPQSDNSITPDVERLVLQYNFSPYFNAGIGRFHTNIGYYNNAFHQGAWFETAIGRPFMYAFDDQGGFLPLQEVGVTTSGQIPSGKLGLSYGFEVGNGRDRLLGGEPAQNRQDSNNGKSVNVALSARPSWIPGLTTGFSIYHDYVTFSDNINHGELISTAYAAYVNSTYEFLNEAMMVRHELSSTGTPGVFHTPAFYTQFSRRFGSYRPYVRYQYINAGDNEPIYGDPTDGPVVGRRNGPSVGVRYDFSEHAASKLQYDHLFVRGQGASNQVAAQFAFTF
jgi:hypothetical protein